MSAAEQCHCSRARPLRRSVYPASCCGPRVCTFAPCGLPDLLCSLLLRREKYDNPATGANPEDVRQFSRVQFDPALQMLHSEVRQNVRQFSCIHLTQRAKIYSRAGPRCVDEREGFSNDDAHHIARHLRKSWPARQDGVGIQISNRKRYNMWNPYQNNERFNYQMY